MTMDIVFLNCKNSWPAHMIFGWTSEYQATYLALFKTSLMKNMPRSLKRSNKWSGTLHFHLLMTEFEPLQKIP